MDHRTLAYSLLTGNGLEIGALHNPAQVPPCCKVSYCDAMPEEEARRSFPELANLPLAHVSHIVNLDQDALTAFGNSSQDFVILNHVIEHVANPIRVIVECFRVLRDGGKLVMSAPDMRFCFDRNRDLTTPAHLWAEYEAGVTEVSDEHYADFLKGVHPEALADPEVFAGAMIAVRDRREHAHVWNSSTFRELLLEVVAKQKIDAHLLTESIGDDNANEYFSVWQKGELPPAHELARLHPSHVMPALEHVRQYFTIQAQQARQTFNDQNTRLASELERLKSELQQNQLTQHRLSLELSTANVQRQELESTLHDLQKAVADKDQHINHIEVRLEIEANAAKERLQTIEAILNSRSWRWTQWLRRKHKSDTE